ncbi:MAG: hypothetical protein AAF694_28975 [Bacteroidota bacterium]
MNGGRILLLAVLLGFLSCGEQKEVNPPIESASFALRIDSLSGDTVKLNLVNYVGKGALLLTRFSSYEELKAVVQIEYSDSKVKLTHASGGKVVESILKKGVSQVDFFRAQDSGFWAKVDLVFASPYAVSKRKDLQRAYALSRRRPPTFGEGDVAFFDFAETMTAHIRAYDRAGLEPKDLSNKGLINTFNHVVAQAFLTSIYSEKMADFIADAHERYNMPELISGEFTAEQIADIENGVVDNYVDMINNEWGQELGKRLKQKYGIKRSTHWTPELLASYLNDMQRYFSRAFGIGFEPYEAHDAVVVRFTSKLNHILDEVPIVGGY